MGKKFVKHVCKSKKVLIINNNPNNSYVYKQSITQILDNSTIGLKAAY